MDRRLRIVIVIVIVIVINRETGKSKPA